MNRSRIRKVLVRISWIIGVFFVLYFLLRVWLLDAGIRFVSDRLMQEKGVRLDVGERGFFGISGIRLSDVSICRPGKDTLLVIDTLALRPALLQLLIGRVGLDYLRMEGATLSLVAKGDSTNYSFLRKASTGKSTNAEAGTEGYGSALRRLLVRSFAMAPQVAMLRNLRLELRSDTLSADLELPQFDSDSRELGGILSEPSTGKSWRITGSFSKRQRTLDLTVCPQQVDHRLPLLRPLTGITAGFDSLRLSMAGMDYGGGDLRLSASFSVTGMSAFHPKIADDTVRILRAGFDGKVVIGERSLELDSSSVVRLNSLILHPYIRIDRRGAGAYVAVLSTDTVAADDFFSSLPEGMFDEVRTVRADGQLQFRVSVELDAAYPDSVHFYCKMGKKGFRLRSAGSSDIFKLNGEFVYDVYENGRFMRSVTVGPSNPSYASLERVSPYFRNSVLTSEDGNFYFHNGFNEEAFRKSIAANFKAGKFKRGGSTITMQLVKNVFLTRKKTIARKAEEALIVWLIESGRLVSKDRLLEVYFNIIELGPDVYGIGEASVFYFNKQPSELDLPESIFLAGLLPRPKWFKSQFDSTGSLKPYVADYYRVMSNFMLRKGLITESEHAALVPNVTLTGRARDLVLPVDSIADESVPEWLPDSEE
ncbi:MAG: hypothetical protein RL213_7 [Bacteroidota bacterium]|jgi:hypothetical protein